MINKRKINPTPGSSGLYATLKKHKNLPNIDTRGEILY